MKSSKFIVFPAIDLRAGQVVRLKQGKRSDMKTFNLDPANAAKKWIEEGAEWLHVVNLDGAFSEESSTNIQALKQILSVANGSAKVQSGGGVRDLASIDFMLSLGISRVILGTAAVREPELMMAALQTFSPQRLALGVDASDGKVRISGWEEKTSISPTALIEKFIPEGLNTVIYTNIQRDGMLSGVDVQGTRVIAEATGMKVIASGGVASLEDIHAVKAADLAGVIVGKALYEDKFKLSEALIC